VKTENACACIFYKKHKIYKDAFAIAGMYIKLIFGDGESSNSMQLQKYVWLASDSDQLSMMV